MANPKEIFTEYYETNFWEGSESLSGPGSGKDQTHILVKELSCLFEKLEVRSILDLPCGDWNWMQELDLSGINYFGGDIVEPLIKTNQKKFGKYFVQFRVIDIINDELPSVDLVLVRDCFIHLSNEAVFKALANIKASKSKWLLTTHFPWLHRQANEEIEIGGYRRVDLTQPPFNFSPPSHIIFEFDFQGWDSDKSLALWQIDQMPI
jgi:SAM-dependent methyltransferase